MASIKLKGREIPLIYTTLEMKKIQEEIGPMERTIEMVTAKNPEDENDRSLYGGVEQLETLGKLVKILGNAGLEENGEEPDLTEKKILRAMKPTEIMEAINACMTAMAEGMASEIPDKEETGPVDVTLEKMKKKETKDD